MSLWFLLKCLTLIICENISYTEIFKLKWSFTFWDLKRHHSVLSLVTFESEYLRSHSWQCPKSVFELFSALVLKWMSSTLCSWLILVSEYMQRNNEKWDRHWQRADGGSILVMGMRSGRIGSKQDGRREDWGRQLKSGPISGTS